MIFLTTTFVLFLCDLDFIAFTYLIVYVGAISVFFLFAVMLLDLRYEEHVPYNSLYLPLYVFIIISETFFFARYYNETYSNFMITTPSERVSFIPITTDVS
jgi:NADH:ubiquinone oxidoreductase subunit 6 (subunit J)